MMTTANRRRRGAARPLPPFPAKQMFVLSLCRICEPIAFMSIFPYIYYMVKDFNITDDESRIAVYAGMVTSSFTFAEFSTGFMWGRISDKIGRKPVLLIGLAGTGLSVLLFGFAPNLPVALFARALGGFLNGNLGVLQTTVAELVTVQEHQPRAYSIMPMIWCIGSILGPMVGGALAKPVDTLPAIFPPGSIWDRFPYLLPNLFSASVVLMSVTVGLLFLEETHAEKKGRHDSGLALGQWLLSLRPWRKPQQPLDTKGTEAQPLLASDDDEPLPGYRTSESSPEIRSLRGSEVSEPLSLGEAVRTSSPKPKTIFNRPIVICIITFGLLAFHTMTFDAELPVFLSTQPDPSKPTSLPFQFPGGFGFDTKRIGVILSVQGFYSLVSTTFLFPMVARWLSALTLFRLLSASYFVLYLVTPYLVLLPDSLRMVGIYTIVVWKCTWATLSYPAHAILLTNSAPTLLSLGTINGVAASTASLSRGFGPTISGALFSLGAKSGYSGLMWWVTALVTLIGAALSFAIPEPRGRMSRADEEAVPSVAEAGDAEERD